MYANRVWQGEAVDWQKIDDYVFGTKGETIKSVALETAEQKPLVRQAREERVKRQSGWKILSSHLRRISLVVFMPRFLLYLLLNLVYPLARPIIRRYHLIDFVTLVYPGTDRDIRSYVLFKWVRYIVPTVSLVGLFIRDGGRRGLTVATGFSAEEMERDKNLTLKIEEALIQFAERAGARAVAVVGRMPGIMAKEKIPIKPPIVQGDKGTLFTLTETVKTVLEREKFFHLDIKIGVLGIGFIGSRLLRLLKDMGFAGVYGVDSDAKRLVLDNGRGIKLGKDSKLLEDCDIVIILTVKGDDAKDTLAHLKDGVIVIDDTHPPLSYKFFRPIQDKGGKIYKAALGLGTMISFPRWPNYDRRWLPGCTIESIVASCNGFTYPTQQAFDKAARLVGFRPLLNKPLGET